MKADWLRQKHKFPSLLKTSMAVSLLYFGRPAKSYRDVLELDNGLVTIFEYFDALHPSMLFQRLLQ
jgi:hypothetical protein